MFKRFSVLVVLILALLVPLKAYGQSTAQFSSVAINIWPAYDRAGVLVIYNLALPATTTLPAQLSIRIPKDAGQPSAVASKESNGQLITLNYDQSENGDWSIINFTATQPELQIEYYDPRLVNKDQLHSFTYTWAGDYEAASMTIKIQQPFGASNMHVSSGSLVTEQGSDGLIYYMKNVGHVLANQQFSLDISYTKASSRLSIEDMKAQPTAPLNGSASWEDTVVGALPWMIALLGLALIFGAGYWYWRSGRQVPVVQANQQLRPSRLSKTAAETAPVEGAVYCHQCGKRATSSDRFCRSCGARLRIE